MRLYLQMGQTYYTIRRTVDLAIESHRTEGITPDNARILFFLENQPQQKAYMFAVAQGLSRDFALVSRQVAILSSKGWLIKKIVREDKRKRTIQLSPKAKRLLPEVHHAIRLALSEAFSPISGIEALELLRIHEEIDSHLLQILLPKDQEQAPLILFP